MGTSLFSHQAPDPSADLNKGIDCQSTQETVEPGATPWPQIGCMKDERQGDMSSDAEAQGENDPFTDQRHESCPMRVERRALKKGEELNRCLGRFDFCRRDETG